MSKGRRKRCIECNELTNPELIIKCRSNKNVCYECIYTEYFLLHPIFIIEL